MSTVVCKLKDRVYLKMPRKAIMDDWKALLVFYCWIAGKTPRFSIAFEAGPMSEASAPDLFFDQAMWDAPTAPPVWFRANNSWSDEGRLGSVEPTLVNKLPFCHRDGAVIWHGTTEENY